MTGTTIRTLIKVGALAVAILLFIIGAGAHSAFVELAGTGLALIAIALLVDSLSGVTFTARQTE